MNIIVFLEENELLKNNLRIILAELNIRQKQICDDLNIKQQRFSNWVNEKAQPSVSEALRVARYLNKSVEEIWEYKE